MKLLLTVLGLVLVLEALPYVLAPQAMQRWLVELSQANPEALRYFGMGALFLGILLCYFGQHVGLFV